MDRFHEILRGLVEAGVDINEHKYHLTYALMTAKGCDSAKPWICFTDAFPDPHTVNDFVEDLVAREYRGNIAPRHDGWHSDPTIHVYSEEKFSKYSFDVEQSPDNGITRKATVVHLPSSSIIHLDDDAPHLLVLNHVNDHVLEQVEFSIERALARQYGRLSHILFCITPEAMQTSIRALTLPLTRLDFYHRMLSVTWAEIEEYAREHQFAAAAVTCNSDGESLLPSPSSNVGSQATKSHPRTRAVETQTPPSDECPICFESGAEHVLLPCAHMFFCEWCAEALQGSNAPCPICRKPVTDIFENYNVHRF